MHHQVPGNVLVFTYRTLKQFFHEVAERTFAGKATYCSAWPGLEEHDLHRDFYRYLRQDSAQVELTPDDYQQIIRRCSVLNLLPWSQAERMVRAMYQVVDRVVEQAQPDYLLTVMVDNYITDLLARICHKRGARNIQLMAGCVPNTITVTSTGEYNHVRNPSPAEVEAALQLFLRDGQRVTYGSASLSSYSKQRHAYASARWWAKAAYFQMSKVLRRDPWNFHYLLGSIVGRDSRCYPWAYDDSQFVPEWEEKVRHHAKPPLLVLLGVFPEATVGYWLRDLRYGNYEQFLLEVVPMWSEHYHVLVKEHPDALGLRSHGFYRQLAASSEVTLVPPHVPARTAVRAVERVLLGAGTAGIEAALRGKRVATLDQPYYFVDGSYLRLGTVEACHRLPDLLEHFAPTPVTPERQRLLIQRVLETTLHGHFLPGPQLNCEENLAATSESLKRYLATRQTDWRIHSERNAA